MSPQARRFLDQLLAAHHAEDALEPGEDLALGIDDDGC